MFYLYIGQIVTREDVEKLIQLFREIIKRENIAEAEADDDATSYRHQGRSSVYAEWIVQLREILADDASRTVITLAPTHRDPEPDAFLEQQYEDRNGCGYEYED